MVKQNPLTCNTSSNTCIFVPLPVSACLSPTPSVCLFVSPFLSPRPPPSSARTNTYLLEALEPALHLLRGFRPDLPVVVILFRRSVRGQNLPPARTPLGRQASRSNSCGYREGIVTQLLRQAWSPPSDAYTHTMLRLRPPISRIAKTVAGRRGLRRFNTFHP